jgi:hypothetical protein
VDQVLSSEANVESKKLSAMMAWCLLAVANRVSSQRGLELGRRLGGRLLKDCEDIPDYFGAEAKFSVLLSAIQLEAEPGVAIRQAAVILKLAFDPECIEMGETFAQNRLRFAIHMKSGLQERTSRVLKELNTKQIEALAAILHSRSFIVDSNLWDLWRVPSSADSLRYFLYGPSGKVESD